jgi:hypothetical protein
MFKARYSPCNFQVQVEVEVVFKKKKEKGTSVTFPKQKKIPNRLKQDTHLSIFKSRSKSKAVPKKKDQVEV